MKTMMILSAAAIALVASPSHANDRKDEAKAQKRFDKKFVEVVQPLQYDGDYSPAAGREAEPEVTPRTPVRFVPAWKRQIPVIVKPAPRYVDPVPAQNASGNGQGQQAPTQSFQQLPSATLTSNALPTPEQADAIALAAQTGSGSATGSTAYPNYATGLPPAGTLSAGTPTETTTTLQTTTTNVSPR